MPKTPFNKNRHVERRDNYVRCAGQPPIMSPETNSMLAEESLNEPFRERI
jgi:hypothetical protein